MLRVESGASSLVLEALRVQARIVSSRRKPFDFRIVLTLNLQDF